MMQSINIGILENQDKSEKMRPTKHLDLPVDFIKNMRLEIEKT